MLWRDLHTTLKVDINVVEQSERLSSCYKLGACHAVSVLQSVHILFKKSPSMYYATSVSLFCGGPRHVYGPDLIALSLLLCGHLCARSGVRKGHGRVLGQRLHPTPCLVFSVA